MDEYECEKCRKSMVGPDGICMNCGWDKFLLEYTSEDRQEKDADEESEEDLEEISLDQMIDAEYADED
jgi:predicted  nucleic acid-binding Zn-ribbon protein